MTAGRPNVAVVVLDTLRYDHFRRYFEWVPGTRFSNAYSTSNWTIPAHASLFTGQYPSEAGVHSKSRSLEDWETALPARLRDRGYRTSMYTANPNLSAREGWTDGFDVVRDAEAFDTVSVPGAIDWSEYISGVDLSKPGFYREVLAGLLGTVGGEASARASLREGWGKLRRDFRDGGTRALAEALDETSFDDEGEFLYVNLMDCHVPYHPPAAYRSVDGPVETSSWEPFVDGVSNLEEIRRAYRDSARYLSDALGPSFEALQDVFDYVVVTSDHGEMLGEHGLVGHVYGLYPELTHVPLVLWGPDLPDERVEDPVSILDIHATVLDIAGVPAESRGRSLLSRPAPERFLTEYQGFPMGIREMFRSNGVSERRCASLDSPLFGSVSPDGQYVYDTHDEGVRGHPPLPAGDDRANGLKRYVREGPVHPVEETDTETDSEDLRRRLEDLGYA
jgi:arylsulfatase A-like enzyme